MADAPPPGASSSGPLPTLDDLRREIDRIDAAMHELLMERGRIIDTLIAVKKTQESGSAFRPGREASMMRALAERHGAAAARHGGEHLAHHHLDLHLRAGALRGARRHLGRRRADARHGAVPFRLHGAVRAASTAPRR